MKHSYLKILNASTNNLKNINLDIPLNKIVCVTGVSGSGKSSLVFHTIFQESRRRFINALPNSQKLFWDVPGVISVDKIEPVMPVWGLFYRNPVLNSRDTIADFLGVSDSLQSFYADNFKILCPKHNIKLVPKLLKNLKNLKVSANSSVNLFIKKEVYINLYGQNAFPSRSSDGVEISDFNIEDDYWELKRWKNYNIVKINDFIQTLSKAQDIELLFIFDHKISKHFNLGCSSSCSKCDYELDFKFSPVVFNPLNPAGACSACNGYGNKLVYDEEKLIGDKNLSLKDGVYILNFSRLLSVKPLFLREIKKAGLKLSDSVSSLKKNHKKILWEGQGDFPGLHVLLDYLEEKKYKKNIRIFLRRIKKEETCMECNGSRLNPSLSAAKVTFDNELLSLYDISSLEISKFYSLSKKYSQLENFNLGLKIACNLGLSNLALGRKIKTLTPGEYQRVSLAKYMSYQSNNSLFVLDEPSTGLSKKEVELLHKELKVLRDRGNSILIVDHNEDLIRKSDFQIHIGPGSGSYGGEIVYAGKPRVSKRKNLNISKLQYLKSKSYIEAKNLSIWSKEIEELKIPINQLTWIKGPSGSGKSSLVINTFANHIHEKIKGSFVFEKKGSLKKLKIPKVIKDVMIFDSKVQKASSRSTVGTYLGLSGLLKKHYAKLPVSKALGFSESTFSPNTPEGACLECEGKGFIEVDLQFLESFVHTCSECKGERLKRKIANLSDGTFTVSKAYNLPMSDFLETINLTPKFQRLFDYIRLLNLHYLSLSRPLSSLSTGELSRLKIIKNLTSKIENAVLFFDGVSHGLSSDDVAKFGQVFESLLMNNNTIIIIDTCEVFSRFSHEVIEFQ